MATVGCDPAVFRLEGSLDSSGDSFLTIVQVTKAANVSCFVFVIASDFHSSHGVHEFEVSDELFLRHGDFIVWGCVQVVSLFQFHAINVERRTRTSYRAMFIVLRRVSEGLSILKFAVN